MCGACGSTAGAALDTDWLYFYALAGMEWGLPTGPAALPAPPTWPPHWPVSLPPPIDATHSAVAAPHCERMRAPARSLLPANSADSASAGRTVAALIPTPGLCAPAAFAGVDEDERPPSPVSRGAGLAPRRSNRIGAAAAAAVAANRQGPAPAAAPQRAPAGPSKPAAAPLPLPAMPPPPPSYMAAVPPIAYGAWPPCATPATAAPFPSCWQPQPPPPPLALAMPPACRAAAAPAASGGSAPASACTSPQLQLVWPADDDAKPPLGLCLDTGSDVLLLHTLDANAPSAVQFF